MGCLVFFGSFVSLGVEGDVMRHFIFMFILNSSFLQICNLYLKRIWVPETLREIRGEEVVYVRGWNSVWVLQL